MTTTYEALPLFGEEKLAPSQAQQKKLPWRYYATRLKEWVLIAPDDLALPKDLTDRYVVYYLSELDRIKSSTDQKLRDLHEIKRLFGGKMLPPDLWKPEAAPDSPDYRPGWEHDGPTQTWRTLYGPEKHFLQGLFDAASALGFPTVDLGRGNSETRMGNGWMILKSHLGWHHFCLWQTGPDPELLIREAWERLREVKEYREEEARLEAMLGDLGI